MLLIIKRYLSLISNTPQIGYPVGIFWVKTSKFKVLVVYILALHIRYFFPFCPPTLHLDKEAREHNSIHIFLECVPLYLPHFYVSLKVKIVGFGFFSFHKSSTVHKLKNSRKNTGKKTVKTEGKNGAVSVIPSHSVAKPSEKEKGSKKMKGLKNDPKYFKVKSFGRKTQYFLTIFLFLFV